MPSSCECLTSPGGGESSSGARLVPRISFSVWTRFWRGLRRDGRSKVHGFSAVTFDTEQHQFVLDPLEDALAERALLDGKFDSQTIEVERDSEDCPTRIGETTKQRR